MADLANANEVRVVTVIIALCNPIHGINYVMCDFSKPHTLARGMELTLAIAKAGFIATNDVTRHAPPTLCLPLLMNRVALSLRRALMLWTAACTRHCGCKAAGLTAHSVGLLWHSVHRVFFVRLQDPAAMLPLIESVVVNLLSGRLRGANVADCLGVDTGERYLQFDHIEEGYPISSRCSRCDKLFRSEPQPGERTDDVLLRLRAEFEAHDCLAP